MVRRYAVHTWVIIGSLFIIFLISEMGFRTLLFSNAPFMSELKDPGLYTDGFSSAEWWKLHYLFGGKEHKLQKSRHPLLGWEQGNFSRETYEHQDAPNVHGRRIVLLYGDSFAHCFTSKEECFQGILNRDRRFSKDYFLLNYGVEGYGVDQIYLLFKNSIHLYPSPLVVIGVYTHDLDRSIVPYFVGQKPYFDIVSDELVLRGTPIDPDPNRYLAENPLRIWSYLYRLWLYQDGRPWRLRYYLRDTEERRLKKERINEKILLSMIAELEARHLQYVFVIFHNESAFTNEDDWRDRFLVRLLEDNRAPYISSKSIISRDMKQRQKKIDDYYRPDDHHPSAYQNILIAQEMKRIFQRAGNW